MPTVSKRAGNRIEACFKLLAAKAKYQQDHPLKAPKKATVAATKRPPALPQDEEKTGFSHNWRTWGRNVRLPYYRDSTNFEAAPKVDHLRHDRKTSSHGYRWCRLLGPQRLPTGHSCKLLSGQKQDIPSQPTRMPNRHLRRHRRDPRYITEGLPRSILQCLPSSSSHRQHHLPLFKLREWTPGHLLEQRGVLYPRLWKGHPYVQQGHKRPLQM